MERRRGGEWRRIGGGRTEEWKEEGEKRGGKGRGIRDGIAERKGGGEKKGRKDGRGREWRGGWPGG